MASVHVTRRIDAPIDQVFRTWGDEFASVYKFHPGLRSSRLLPDSPASAGEGATRQCNLADGKNWMRERIVGYRENEEIVVDIYESTMPLKSARGTFRFRAAGANATDVTFVMDFVPGMGPLGTLMLPMMKPQFRKQMASMLEGNAAYVESGRQANPTRAAA